MSNLFNPGKYVSLDLADSDGNAFAVMGNSSNVLRSVKDGKAKKLIKY